MQVEILAVTSLAKYEVKVTKQDCNLNFEMPYIKYLTRLSVEFNQAVLLITQELKATKDNLEATLTKI